MEKHELKDFIFVLTDVAGNKRYYEGSEAGNALKDRLFIDGATLQVFSRRLTI